MSRIRMTLPSEEKLLLHTVACLCFREKMKREGNGEGFANIDANIDANILRSSLPRPAPPLR
jgi:hypothetical protein